jgi:hypothetical protein
MREKNRNEPEVQLIFRINKENESKIDTPQTKGNSNHRDKTMQESNADLLHSAIQSEEQSGVYRNVLFGNSAFGF